MLDKVEQSLIECRKTNTKVITLTNHNGRRQFNEPIRTRSKYVWSALSTGKRVQAIHDCVLDPRAFGLFFLGSITKEKSSGVENGHDWFLFYFRLVEKVVRVSFFSQSQGVVMQNQSNCKITFETQLKPALCD